MDDHTLKSLRRIFLNPRPNIAYITAAYLLGMTFSELKNEIAEGTIVAVSTGIGMRVAKEEMIATAMRTWPQAVIEEALGDDAARLLPRMTISSVVGLNSSQPLKTTGTLRLPPVSMLLKSRIMDRLLQQAVAEASKLPEASRKP